MMKRRLGLLLAAVLLSITLVACGTTLQGTYRSANGMMSVEFKSGKVYVEVPMGTVECAYELDGDEVVVKDKPKSRQLALRNLELTQIAPVPDWLVANRDALSGKVSRIPTRDEMQPMVNEQLIVELYSR